MFEADDWDHCVAFCVSSTNDCKAIFIEFFFEATSFVKCSVILCTVDLLGVYYMLSAFFLLVLKNKISSILYYIVFLGIL